MNDCSEKSLDSYRSLLLLSEIAGEETLSQRELSRRLGFAVGLVNSCLKHLVAKGYVRVKNFPKNRYAYLLTPQGLAEKSRLAYQHLSYFANLYTVTRQDYLTLFRKLSGLGVKAVSFCGVDEVAEIAYLSLRETDVRLTSVSDDHKAGQDFFEYSIVDPSTLVGDNLSPIVITSLKRREQLESVLVNLGVPAGRLLWPGQFTESV